MILADLWDFTSVVDVTETQLKKLKNKQTKINKSLQTG